MDALIPPVDHTSTRIQSTQNALTRVSSQKDLQDTQLREAVNEFVSVFLSKIFKDMDEAIPRSGLMGEGFGESWFRQMLYDEYAQVAARQTLKQMGEAVYRQVKQTARTTP
ncbi:MAG TPA: rod-binding protein [Thermotogota bacterium]|nr:rod-binding protein [Thermotogota bacterium]